MTADHMVLTATNHRCCFGTTRCCPFTCCLSRCRCCGCPDGEAGAERSPLEVPIVEAIDREGDIDIDIDGRLASRITSPCTSGGFCGMECSSSAEIPEDLPELEEFDDRAEGAAEAFVGPLSFRLAFAPLPLFKAPPCVNKKFPEPAEFPLISNNDVVWSPKIVFHQTVCGDLSEADCDHHNDCSLPLLME